MKKISILFLLIILCFIMSACSNNENVSVNDSSVDNTLQKINEDSYALGLEYEKDGKFVEAINLFKSIPEASSLYENAQDRIVACTSEYQDVVLLSMKEFVEEGLYNEIYKLYEKISADKLVTEEIEDFIENIKKQEKINICNDALSKIENIVSPLEQYYILIEVPKETRTDEFNDFLEIIKENVIKHVVSEIDKYFEVNDYINAINYINNLPTEFKIETIKNKQEEAYVLYVDYSLKKADEMSKTSVSNAIDYLTKANNQWSDHKFSEKITSLENILKADEFNKLIKIYATEIDMNSAGGIKVEISWENKSSKEIKYISFRTVLYNRVNDIISSEIGNKTYINLEQTGPVPQGKGCYYIGNIDYVKNIVRKRFTKTIVSYDEYLEDIGKDWADSYWDNVWYNYDGYYAKIVGVEIDYMDGTTYKLENEEFFEALGIINVNLDEPANKY